MLRRLLLLVRRHGLLLLKCLAGQLLHLLANWLLRLLLLLLRLPHHLHNGRLLLLAIRNHLLHSLILSLRCGLACNLDELRVLLLVDSLHLGLLLLRPRRFHLWLLGVEHSSDVLEGVVRLRLRLLLLLLLRRRRRLLVMRLAVV